MAKFVYRLQNILNIKYKLEEQAKSEYAIASQILHEEEIKLQVIYDDINMYENTLRNLNSGSISVMDVKQCLEAIAFKKNAAETQKIIITRAENKLERARAKLNEVMIDRKTHEKLREKAFDEFVSELSAQEKKEIDELVSYKYNNRGTGDNNG